MDKQINERTNELGGMDGRANERTNRRRTEGWTGVKITVNNFAYRNTMKLVAILLYVIPALIKSLTVM